MALNKGQVIGLIKGICGSSDSPAPVVILPETELTYDETEDGFFLLTPWMVDLVAGGVYDVTYNGVKYECEGVPATESGFPGDPIALGNVGLMGLTGGNTDAPFAVMCLHNEGGAEMGVYAMLANTDDATSVTLSIVQTEGASADSGSDGGGVFIVTATPTTGDGGASATFDKTYEETLAAIKAGKNVVVWLTEDTRRKVFYPSVFGDDGMSFMYIVYSNGIKGATIAWLSTGQVVLFTAD